MKIDKTTAKRLFLESPQWFKERLIKKYGAEFFEKRDFNDIKTFEDACEELGIDPDEEFNGDDLIDEAAYKKLKVIVAAINQGWTPDWDNTDQQKWWPYFKLSSGFGFSHSYYVYDFTRVRMSALAFALRLRRNAPMLHSNSLTFTNNF